MGAGWLSVSLQVQWEIECDTQRHPPLASAPMRALSQACTGNRERREKQLLIWGKRTFNLSLDKHCPLPPNFGSSRLLLS